MSKRWTDLDVDWHAIKFQIDSAPHGTTMHRKKQLADQLGISIHSLQAAIRTQFGPAKTIIKEPVIDRDLIYIIAEMKVASMRAGSGERKLPTWRCIEVLKDLKVPGAETLTKSTVDRVLREEFGMNQPVPHTRWEPEYALQEVQVDFSPSKYFRPGKLSNHGQPTLIATDRILSYKENDIRRRLMLGVIMDTYSRIRFHSGYICAGESALNSIDFLTDFFTRPEDDLVFRHLAWNFRIDNGPLFKSQMGKSFFETIDRPVENTIPYGKTGLGKAERGWQLVWSWEQDLAMRIGPGGTISLEEYNELLLAECVRQQEMAHPFRSSEKKIDLYQRSVLQQDPRPEIINVDLSRLVFTSLKRKVGTDQLVRINNEFYQVPVMAGDHYTTDRWIRIITNKEGKMMGELIDRHAPAFEVLPESRSLRGDFHAAKQTTKQRINTDLDEGRSVMAQIRAQSGRVLPGQSASMKRLMPNAEEAKVNSPFHKEDAREKNLADRPESFKSKFAAMHWIGNTLQTEGVPLEDDLMAYFEDYVIQTGLDRTDIEAQVKAFLSELNNQSTGT